jgi:hypothetical protein
MQNSVLMNPLSLPKWGKKQPLQLQYRWKSVDPGPLPSLESKPYFKNKREEILDEAKLSSSKVTIQIAGVDSNNRSYTLAHEPGANLGHYLGLLDLKNIITKSAAYDLTNIEAGRVKLRYILSPESKIFFGPISYSPVSHLQKATSDPKAVIYGDVSLRYGTSKLTNVKTKKSEDDVEQW